MMKIIFENKAEIEINIATQWLNPKNIYNTSLYFKSKVLLDLETVIKIIKENCIENTNILRTITVVDGSNPTSIYENYVFASAIITNEDGNKTLELKFDKNNDEVD